MKKIHTLFLVLFSVVFALKTNAQVIESFYVYPNPVSSELTIGIKTNTFSRLSLDVFDVTGQKVMSPFNDSIFWPGTHLLTYNISFLDIGLYFLTLETNSGEKQTIKVVKSTPVSINDIEVASLSVYPNPANNVIHLPENVTEVRVYDMTGKLALNQVNPSSTIDVTPLKNGLYVVKLIGDSSTSTILEIQR